MEESRVRFRRQSISVRPHQVSQRLTQHSGSWMGWSPWKSVQLIFRKNPNYKIQLYVAFNLQRLFITQHFNSTAHVSHDVIL